MTEHRKSSHRLWLAAFTALAFAGVAQAQPIAPPPSPVPPDAPASVAPLTGAATVAGEGELARQVNVARDRVYPALVNIVTVRRTFHQGRARRSSVGGSGVIVSADGYVLTNSHVATHATHIVCRLPSGEELEASEVTDDPLTDLSVLKLHLERRKVGTPLPFARLGDATRLATGDQVLAMGNPMMLGSSMTLGIVSNPHRVFIRPSADDLHDLDFLVAGERTGLLTRWIQHDALILPGNSGGPLVDMKGEVVGINELGGGGVGFAIPANVAATVLAAARATGEVERGWLGLGVLPVQKAGLEHGALVGDVWPGSPAEKAGLHPGDVLEAIDGKPVTARFFEEVPLVYQAIADLRPGNKVRLDLRRQGVERSVQATVTRMGRFAGDEEEVAEVGASLQEITAAMALFREYPDASGLVITGVRPGYPFESAKPPIAAGDVLLAVGDAPTSSLGALRDGLKSAGAGSFRVTVRRDSEVLVSVVSPRREKPDNSSTELPKAWLGVHTQVLTPELAKALDLGSTQGLRISEVLAATRAKAAGLRVGDILVAVNGQPLTSSRSQDAQDLKHIMEDLPIDKPVSLGLLRDHHPLTLAVDAEPEPKGTDLAATATQADFEFSVREIVATDRMEERVPATVDGVLVSDVVEGGLASLAGLGIDDVVMAVDDRPVNSVASFKAAMEEVKAQRPSVVKLFLRRGYKTHFVFIEPEWDQQPKGH